MARNFSTHRPIRAMRLRNAGETITARADALRPFLGASLDDRLASLRRMLRQERRAAGSGVGYDAARHAALRRLLDEAGQASK